MTISPSSFFFFRVSQLAHYCFCPNRARIEIFENPDWQKYQDKNKPMQKGAEIHAAYSAPYKSWDRRLLRYQLQTAAGPIFQKQLKDDNIVIRGVYDDLRILHDVDHGKKLVSFVELKTTNRGMLGPEISAAIFQLQLYVWMMKDLIKPPWVVHARHYLEIINQKTGRLIKRIVVREDPEIEEKIRCIVRTFQGHEKVSMPAKKICDYCPKPIKERCEWFKYKYPDIG